MLGLPNSLLQHIKINRYHVNFTKFQVGPSRIQMIESNPEGMLSLKSEILVAYDWNLWWDRHNIGPMRRGFARTSSPWHKC